MRLALLLVVLCAACTDRALGIDDPVPLDLAVAIDASVPVVDLARIVDLAEPPYDGSKRHLLEPCTLNGECLSGDCVTADESQGEYDNLCGQRCDSDACGEGLCLTYDHQRYWCLPACSRAAMNADCPKSFVCCESGHDVATCVSVKASTCEPK